MVKVTKQVAAQNRAALAAAADVLARREGLGKAGLGAIAKRAGLTTGAIYAGFGSREALMAAGIEAGFARMCDWLDSLPTGAAYLAQVRGGGRLADGALWCPAASHIGTIRSASEAEQAAFAAGLARMLARMAAWPDVGSPQAARALLAQASGEALFAGLWPTGPGVAPDPQGSS